MGESVGGVGKRVKEIIKSVGFAVGTGLGSPVGDDVGTNVGEIVGRGNVGALLGRAETVGGNCFFGR